MNLQPPNRQRDCYKPYLPREDTDEDNHPEKP